MILAEQVHDPNCIAFHPNGQHIAWAMPGRGIEVWDVEARRRVRRFEMDEHVTSIVFLPDSVRAFSNRFYATPKIWDVETGATIAEIPWDACYGSTIDAVSADGRTLVLCDEAGNVAVFDIDLGRRIASHPSLLPYMARGIFHPNGREIAFGVDRGASPACVRVFDVDRSVMRLASDAAPMTHRSSRR